MNENEYNNEPTSQLNSDGTGITRRRLVKTTGAIAAASAFGLGAGTGTVGAQVSEDLCEAVPNDVMLVLDRSGSMLFQPNKFQNAKNGAKAFVDELTSADEAGLVSFNGSATLDQAITSNLSDVKTAIDALSAFGGTDIGEAITLAQGQFPNRTDASDIMVLLSDGVSVSGVSEAQAAKDAGTRIITIAYGTDADTATLAEIASDPDDENAFVASIDNIEDIFQTIAQEICPTEVDCDIKPRSDPNAINPNKGGVIPVAILTTDDFDATTVDPDSLRFGSPSEIKAGGGATLVHEGGHTEDVDGDGDMDFVGHFSAEDAGFSSSDTEGWLVGMTEDGESIACSDSVKIVGGGGKP